MNYITKNNFEEEPHPWPPFIPPNAKALIIGTFPTQVKNRNFEFFYPNGTNRFWTILSEITGISIKHKKDNEAVKERKKILEKLKIGITDMGKIVYRQNRSSSDQMLFPIEFTNIFKLLEKHNGVCKLILTSSSGVNNAESWFRNYCNLNNIWFPKLKDNNPKRSKIELFDREIEIVTVDSPSVSAWKKKESLIEMYAKVIR